VAAIDAKPAPQLRRPYFLLRPSRKPQFVSRLLRR
jgi:hypothetical protein